MADKRPVVTTRKVGPGMLAADMWSTMPGEPRREPICDVEQAVFRRPFVPAHPKAQTRKPTGTGLGKRL